MSSFAHSRAPLAAAVAVAAMLLAGCAAQGPASGATSEAPTAGGTLKLGGLVTKAIDPGVSTFSSQSRPFVYPVYSSLFKPTESGEIGPGLASEYAYSDDGLQLTITLRDDLVFSDDTPLDADAVIWNFQRYIDNKTREAQYFKSVTDMKATDPTTVVVTFSQPQSTLLEALSTSSAGFMSSQAALEEMGADAFNAAPVGAGPFKIDSADPGQEIRYVKNDLYWDAENVYLDGIQYLNTGVDPQGSLTSLQSGTIDVIELSGTSTPATLLATVENDPELQLNHGIAGYVSILPVNTFSAPFDDLRARQAINYCMDREAIANSVLQGYGSPAYVMAGDSIVLSGWEEGKELNPLQHDVAKGTELVEDLGGLDFTIVSNLSSPVVTALTQQWAECGIKATFQRTDDWNSLLHNGNYQAAFAVNANGSQNPAMALSWLDPDQANNSFGWRDDAIWSNVQEAVSTADETASTELWHEIFGDLAEQGFVNPIVSAPYYAATSNKVHGVTQYGVLSDFTNAWLEQ